jgi:hypothetical protein
MKNVQSEKGATDTMTPDEKISKERPDGGATIFYVNKRAGVKAVLESEEFREAGGVAVFKQSPVVVYVGVFVVLLVLLALIPTEKTFINIIIKALLAVFFGATGLRAILDGLIARVILKPEGIVYRNFCGMEQAICWQDVREVRSRHIETDTGFFEYLLVIGEDTKIKISWCYIAYGALRNEIKKRWKQNKNKNSKTGSSPKALG